MVWSILPGPWWGGKASWQYEVGEPPQGETIPIAGAWEEVILPDDLVHPLTVLEECEESLCAHCHTVSLLGASVHLSACFALLAGWVSASEVDKAGPPMSRRGYSPGITASKLGLEMAR